MSFVEAARHRIEAAFQRNFADRGEVGASLSIWEQGQEVLSLAHGWRDLQQVQPWTADTLVLFWSMTKGLAAGTVLHVLERAELSLDRPVAHVWPEFAQNGKGEITLAQVLSHRAGLAALENPPPVDDFDAVVAALERAAPDHEPGTPHGYHPRTFGFLLDALVRRMAGVSLGQYWRQAIAEPLDLEAWIGVPDDVLPRVAPVLSSRVAPTKDDPFFEAVGSLKTMTGRAFATPRGLLSPSAMNTPAVRKASYPAFGGIGTARGVAGYYAMLADVEGRALTFYRPETLAHMQTALTSGRDGVLLIDTAFSAGFMMDPLADGATKQRMLFGPSLRAFGHPGAGGSLAFADPERQIGFAYIMNQMEPGVLPNRRAQSLVKALYDLE